MQDNNKDWSEVTQLTSTSCKMCCFSNVLPFAIIFRCTMHEAHYFLPNLSGDSLHSGGGFATLRSRANGDSLYSGVERMGIHFTTGFATLCYTGREFYSRSRFFTFHVFGHSRFSRFFHVFHVFTSNTKTYSEILSNAKKSNVEATLTIEYLVKRQE